MKKNYLLIAFIAVSITATAQSIGIGTTTPNASAMLEIKASNKGLLIPRTSTTTRTAIVNPAKGLLIYDSTTSSFWFHNGSSWVQIGASGNGWSLSGNTGTNPTTNFLGTTDAQSLLFKVNNIQAGIIDYNKANTGFGLESLLSNAAGTYNSAIGTQALRNNITGISNTAIGYEALELNNGSGNAANGFQALVSNTTGNANTANGFHSLFSNTTGYSNVAIGAGALYNNQMDNHQVAIGDSALFNFGTGNQFLANEANTAVGSEALYSTTQEGNANTADGFNAMHGNTTGTNNTAIGCLAFYQVPISGHNNTGLGSNTSLLSGDQVNSTAVGYLAVSNASNKMQLGNTITSTIATSGGYTIVSDVRFKDNINDNAPGLSFIAQLHPVAYNFNYKRFDDFVNKNRKEKNSDADYQRQLLEKSTHREIGFIAQEVEKLCLDSNYVFNGVYKPQNENDNYGLDYSKFVVPLVKAVQEQQQMIEDLKKENADIKEQLKKLIEIISKK